MNPYSHPADISVITPVGLAAPRRSRPDALSDRHERQEVLNTRQQTVALTLATTAGTLLLGLGLIFAVTSLAGRGAPAAVRIGTEPATSVLVSRILPVVAAILVGGGLGWLRRSRPIEGW